jgi:hypothetical protein
MYLRTHRCDGGEFGELASAAHTFKSGILTRQTQAIFVNSKCVCRPKSKISRILFRRSKASKATELYSILHVTAWCSSQENSCESESFRKYRQW